MQPNLSTIRADLRKLRTELGKLAVEQSAPQKVSISESFIAGQVHLAVARHEAMKAVIKASRIVVEQDEIGNRRRMAAALAGLGEALERLDEVASGA